MKEIAVWIFVFILLVIGLPIGVTALSDKYGPLPLEAAENCQQYADKSVYLMRDSRSTASWAQIEALQALAYATLYSGCRSR